jgi:hypothetical protein
LTSPQVKPQDITPLLSSPFMTTHGCRVAQPLSEILATPEYFNKVSSNLRVGDRVQLVRFEHGDWTKARVVEFVEVIIVQKRANTVEFAQSGPLIEIPEAAPQPETQAQDDSSKPATRRKSSAA